MQKDKLVQWGGWKHFKNTFPISYMLNSRNRVFNSILVQYGIAFLLIIRGLNQLPFRRKKYYFLCTFYLAIYGQSCIKTVRGPLHVIWPDEKMHMVVMSKDSKA